MADNRRQSRVGEQILRDISTMLEQELAEKVPGMVTFTQVRLTKDLRYATVYYSVLGKEGAREQVASYLERENRRIRRMVGAGLRMRFIPEFTFKFDPSIEESIRIQQLLDEIKNDRKEDE